MEVGRGCAIINIPYNSIQRRRVGIAVGRKVCLRLVGLEHPAKQICTTKNVEYCGKEKKSTVLVPAILLRETYKPPTMGKRSLQSNPSVRKLKKRAENLLPNEGGGNIRLVMGCYWGDRY